MKFSFKCARAAGALVVGSIVGQDGDNPGAEPIDGPGCPGEGFPDDGLHGLLPRAKHVLDPQLRQRVDELSLEPVDLQEAGDTNQSP